jgi:hypothetical protein
VFLTPAAAPHLDAIAQVAAAIRIEALRGLEQRQATIVLSALRKMRDNLSVG